MFLIANRKEHRGGVTQSYSILEELAGAEVGTPRRAEGITALPALESYLLLVQQSGDV